MRPRPLVVAAADFERRVQPLRGNAWFDSALARLGVASLGDIARD